MSGGMWNYLGNDLETSADDATRAINAVRLLAAIEHEMDWGISCDTCYECAKLRTIAALETYFGDGGFSSQSAIAVARDGQQNLCEKCQERKANQK